MRPTPIGPDMEYAAEKPADPLEIRVYRGASGTFTLYEDENEGYDYEKAVYATIAMRWDDGAKVLTIGARTGSFPGMLASRTFRVVFVDPDHGTGIGQSPQPDRVVQYNGQPVEIRQ